MVAEGVPGQFRDQAMVLVGVVTAGGDHQVGSHLTLEVLEHLLDLGPCPGVEAVPERLEYDGGLLDVLQKRPGAADRLPFPDARGRQEDPGDAQREAAGGQLKDGPATADLDIVGMRPDDQDLERRPCGSGSWRRISWRTLDSLKGPQAQLQVPE
jgi:hypothetical protein